MDLENSSENFIQTNALAMKSWVSDLKLARMETLHSEISEPSFVVLKIGDCDDLDFWCNKAKNFTKTFSSIPVCKNKFEKKLSVMQKQIYSSKE